MELLVIILVIVYSVWSEVNKKKQEENVDIDFSELSSLDDFFKDTGSQAEKSAVAPLSSQAKPPKKRSKKRSEPTRGEVDYDDLPSLTGQVNYDRQSSASNESNYDLSEEARKLFTNEEKAAPSAQTPAKPIQLSFDRESFIKAFVMSEVLQRYDLERIYSRIPNINQPED
ncbi:MAG: hypothetical protein KKB51_13570 [Candidatus Riflebacteria bacterium]|nr:hypothetical protein [Candidatus Riflebacteria bacterium]